MFEELKLKNLRLRVKLVLLLLLISVIPLLAISISNYFYAKSELEKTTIENLRAVNNSRAAYINHSIQLRQEQAKAFAGAYLPRQLSESGYNDPALIKGIQEDIESTFRDLNQEPTSPYQDIDKKTDIAIISIWDVLGNIVASTNKELINRKMPIDFLQKVFDRKGTYFAGFQKDPLTGKNLLIILEEIRNWKTNRLVGVVSLKVSTKTLNEITTEREGLGYSGETYLVDRNYLMITPSRFVDDSILNRRVITLGTQACLKSNSYAGIYKNYLNKDVLGVQKYLPDQKWCLISEVDAGEALRPVQELRTRTLVLGGLLIFVILIFAYLASHTLIKPILKLHEASQKIKRGQFDITVQAEGRDEIADLSRAFNEMAKSLKLANQELEEKSKILFQNLAVSTSQKKELKKVNQELDSFVYTASHDLRAPLRAIASFATFLEEDYKGKLGTEGQEYIDEIRKGATKMNAFIEDLLTLSRISRIKNPYEDVDIRMVLETAIERLKFEIKEKQVNLVAVQHLPVMHCDRIKITEVFYNLINNAIKFSSKNNKENPRVKIGYAKIGDLHQFFVKDNGIGIDPKYHEQIFGIFKRLHSDKEYEGTGAGLSIIKKVIDDHQGKIWVESELGKGAAFYFTIPDNLREDIRKQE